jgi:predicted anti-sigma-YlaC factor YlaD
MPRSSCRELLAQLSEILDGEATMLQRARFRSHLALCGPCLEYYRQFRAVQQAAGVVFPADLPDDLDGLMSFLSQEAPFTSAG